MSLDKKIKDVLEMPLTDIDFDVNQCVQICDEEMVKFAEWIRINAYDTGACWYFQESDEEYTTTELLEIYKQGL